MATGNQRRWGFDCPWDISTVSTISTGECVTHAAPMAETSTVSTVSTGECVTHTAPTADISTVSTVSTGECVTRRASRLETSTVSTVSTGECVSGGSVRMEPGMARQRLGLRAASLGATPLWQAGRHGQAQENPTPHESGVADAGLRRASLPPQSKTLPRGSCTCSLLHKHACASLNAAHECDPMAVFIPGCRCVF